MSYHFRALLCGAIAEAGVDVAVYRNQTEEGSISFGEASLGGGVGLGLGGIKAKGDAKIDLVHAAAKLGDIGTLDANLGLNVSTGVEIGAAGFGFSVLGFGVSVGRKTGISTPFGEISLNL